MRVSHGWGMARVLCMALVLALVLAVPAFAEKVIDNIKVADHPDRVEITVSSNAVPYFNPKISQKGDYICFAFAGRCAVKGTYQSIRTGGVFGIRYGAFSSWPPVTRVVVNTNRYLGYSSSYSSDKHSVTLTVWKHGAKPEAAPKPAAPAPTPAPAVKAAAPAPAPAAKPTAPAAPLTTAARVPPPTPFVARAVEQKGSDSGEEPSQALQPSTLPAPVPSVARTPVAPVVRTPLVPVTMAKAVSSVRPSVRRNISLDFVAADINDVLKALSMQSGANIVCGSDVKGSVTVSLNNVGVEEALDYVARLSGYKYARNGDTYVVGSAQGVGSVTSGDAGSDDTCSEAVSVRYCDVKGLLDMLGKQFPDLKCSSNVTEKEGEKPKTGVKLVAFVGPKSSVAQAKALAEQVEASFEKEANGRAVQVYEVKYADAKELADMLASVMPQVTCSLAPSDGFEMQAPGPVSIDSNQGAQVTSSGGTALPTADQRNYQRLVLTGTPADVKQAIDVLDRTDIRVPQVLIEAKVTDISLTAEHRLGLLWSWSDITFQEGTRAEPVPAAPTTRDVAGSGKFFRLPMNVTATLDAMFKDGTAKLLANPHVTSVEGKPAVFFVGDEIKYVINMTTTVNGVTITTETAKVGIQLRAVADVSPDKEITLNLHPEVSVISDYVRVTPGGGGTNTLNSGILLPQIARRFTDQTIRVKDGESIVIGGLIQEKELNNLTKVPFLGDLPFFGGLFRHREKTRDKSEIVIFLKASIVD